MAYAFDEDDVLVWKERAARSWGQPAEFIDHLDYIARGGIVMAHNAAFELAIWNNIGVPRYGWPELKIEQVRCTMAMAYAMALPGKLEKAAAAVGLEHQKDMKGHRLMMQMAAPREILPDGSIVWWDDAEKRERLYEYCKQDVRTERELAKRLLPLSDAEQRLWVLDRKINNRGIYVDRKVAENALKAVSAEATRLDADMRVATGNSVACCTEAARLRQWCAFRGVEMESVDKAAVKDALARPDLPPDVRQALLVRKEAGKTSTAKIKPMLEASSVDGRVRDTMQYHGAGTGRWAGRKLNPLNMPRPTLKQPQIEQMLDLLARADDPEDAVRVLDLFGNPLDAISNGLRGMIRAASGNVLYAADFANIEGRALAWLAGEHWKVQAFKDFDAGRGKDIYLIAAEGIYGKVFTKDDPERQHGKVSELACGYGGGVGAFQQMAKTYLVYIADDLAQTIKEAWRDKHPAIAGVKDDIGRRRGGYWNDLELAALAAVQQPGMVFTAGPTDRMVRFRMRGSFLWCQLPSSRVLCYPYPVIKPRETPWGAVKDQLHYMTQDQNGRWVETHTYGGKLSENVTQAFCRDLLVDALWRVEAAGYQVVLHVYDEIVAEVRRGFGDLKEFEALCSAEAPYAPGLPIVAAGWTGKRYRKA